jgi:hypothetical protein
VAEARLSKAAGKRVSREAHTATRIERSVTKKGQKITEYKNLTKAELIKALKKAGGRSVLLKFKGVPHAGALYRGRDISTLNDEHWVSGAGRISAEELLDEDNFADFVEMSGISGKPLYGLIVYG